MNLTRAFSFVFDDPDWWKITLTIGLLQFIPFVGQIALLGCTIMTARSLASGQERPLPRLDQIGDMFREGFSSLIISVFYYLPIIIFSCFFFCLVGVIIASSSNREPPFGILIGLLICFSIMLLPFTLITQPALLIGIGRYVQTGSFSAALQPGEIWQWFRNYPVEWLVLWLVSVLCYFVASLGSIFFMIGIIFSVPYAAFVFGHLLGQTVRQVTTTPAPPSL
ncbi:MAG: DUF4013 domain-containing protein [Chloroflexus sp.]|jgi:hypothetical protein|uniref:DUF4013 domain-containing protein n=1 Tax=Chloroflexus sp. MS-CIW-1 TaxID=3055768 RepID=UPI001B09870C|nr:DUF4013 domain-containing protein [Chloroflexus sp. MS-CIW-1]MBO9311806.1 DUF4013 domain-containing protein [Chloroflexus sp.]MBO9314930.1 DUF4013 domain-containing protein [Chloroflexus sp.]MBO9318191.1 DUF4013 domain-containing protein [Chloroflexus sp.]MBO9371919.1 DUF4013 domain-containing protein [Chloroflexus sp.]MDN5273628.1 DUF4013 domain-containing protein [Chloroflexus sp. MS-CIW-1]